MERGSMETAMQAWCAATGMKPWSPDEDMVAMLDATPVCIHFEPNGEGCAMHFLLALGASDTLHITDKLLQLNFDSKSPGCFGVERLSGDVFYRLSISLDSFDDAGTIPAYVGSVVETARSLLAAS